MTGARIELPDFMLAAGRADWEAAVAKALKGGDVARLRTVTRNGVILDPLGTTETPVAPLPGWRASPRWRLVQRQDMPGPDAANPQVLADLDGGADALDLVFAPSPNARGFGLDGARIATVLAGVQPDLVELRVDAGEATPRILRDVQSWAISTAPGARFALVASYDPLGLALAQGGTDATMADLVAAGTDLATVTGTAFTPDGRVVHAAGGTDVQELAYVLSAAVHYWRALGRAGLDTAAAADLIGFTLAADVDQFATIAKFRALRLLWALAQEEAGIAPRPARIHAETAYRMMSTLDVHTNILRTTIAAFSAGMGGADSITVLPFTSAAGLPEAFARRVARNSQAILLDEANLYRVEDPGAGAGAIEAETQALAARAWDLFKVHEAAGGIATQISSGTFQTSLAVVHVEQARDVARRKLPITGASEFADLGGAAPSVLAPAVATAPRSRRHPATALGCERLSEPFEALRAASDAALARSGSRPAVFLATMGGLSDFAPRATWTRNLVEVGGITAAGGVPFASPEALVEAFRAAETPVAILVSSDAVYDSAAEQTISALKAAGARRVIMAGKPATPGRADALTTAGLGGFIHAGQDVVATLRSLQRDLGLLARDTAAGEGRS